MRVREWGSAKDVIAWDLGDRGWRIGGRREKETVARREFSLANTGKNSIEVHGVSNYLLAIIRMEREGVEEAGVEELQRAEDAASIRARTPLRTIPD
jgi:hypothetical protein